MRPVLPFMLTWARAHAGSRQNTVLVQGMVVDMSPVSSLDLTPRLTALLDTTTPTAAQPGVSPPPSTTVPIVQYCINRRVAGSQGSITHMPCG